MMAELSKQKRGEKKGIAASQEETLGSDSVSVSVSTSEEEEGKEEEDERISELEEEVRMLKEMLGKIQQQQQVGATTQHPARATDLSTEPVKVTCIRFVKIHV